MSARGCSVTGCERSYRTKGLCHMHAERMRRNGTTDRLVPPPKPPPSSHEEILAECWAAYAEALALAGEIRGREGT